jgi:hypothetical protein
MQVLYLSNRTGATYRLNVEPLEQAAAEGACNAAGGHLVSYASLAEQYEAEQFFLNKGLLLPSHHLSYWIGLSAGSSWPNFKWMDNVTPSPGLGSAFSGWGALTFANKSAAPLKEPNNYSFNWTRLDESCAAANSSQAFNNAWGWSDAQCSLKLPSMCKVAAPRMYMYTSSNGSGAFAFNSAALDQKSAEKACNDNGGHLVSYGSEAEQLEVEGYFIGQGFLLPG